MRIDCEPFSFFSFRALTYLTKIEDTKGGKVVACGAVINYLKVFSEL